MIPIRVFKNMLKPLMLIKHVMWIINEMKERVPNLHDIRLIMFVFYVQFWWNFFSKKGKHAVNSAWHVQLSDFSVPILLSHSMPLPSSPNQTHNEYFVFSFNISKFLIPIFFFGLFSLSRLGCLLIWVK